MKKDDFKCVGEQFEKGEQVFYQPNPEDVTSTKDAVVCMQYKNGDVVIQLGSSNTTIDVDPSFLTKKDYA